jgi:hypothetical protein
MKIKSIIILSFISLILLGCDVSEQKNNVQLRLELEKYELPAGGTLNGFLTVTNLSTRTVSYNFSTACQFGLIIKSGNTAVRNFPELCAEVLTFLNLKPGETHVYEFSLQLEDNENNSLPKGSYTIEAFLLENDSEVVSKTFEIN